MLTYAEMTEQVQAWSAAFPSLVRLSSLAQTEGGRELWLLTIGEQPDRIRPAFWVDANMHAMELCGSSVALSIAEDVIQLHLEAGRVPAERNDLSEPVARAAREALWYVLPRMSPDGAEEVIRSGRTLRSAPRDARLEPRMPRWISRDMDGDGRALIMRVKDVAGDFVETPEVPGLMVPRNVDDVEPFYKIYPEGVIEPWDGQTVPDPSLFSDNDTDLNRNFPYFWAPEPEQQGAGRFPLSELESRAVVEFTTAHPNIIGWLNLHTFGGVHIRPRGDKPDHEMNPGDLALYRQVEAWANECTGYPMVSGFEEFTYEPNKPLHGDATDYAYHQRGCLAWVCELWDLFEQLSLPRPKRFVDRYTHLSRADMISLGRWDAEHNEGRMVRPWNPVQHPQLGEVEVGGLDPSRGVWNPPPDRIAGICREQSVLAMQVSAMLPRLGVDHVASTPLGEDMTALDFRIENLGYVSTYGIPSAKELSWNIPLVAEVRCHGGSLVSPRPRVDVGHLEGWGRGLFSGSDSLFYARSRGSVSRRLLRCVVRGSGTLELLVRGPRVGERSVRCAFGSACALGSTIEK